MLRRCSGLVLAAILILACASTPAVSPAPTGLPTNGPTTAPSDLPSPAATDIADPTTPPRPTPQPTRPLGPMPTITTPPSGEAFTMAVLPPENPVEARPAIPGERICFLIDIDDSDPADGVPSISAVGDGLTITDVSAVRPGSDDLVELWVEIAPGSFEFTAHVAVTASHPGQADWTETRSILVTPVDDDRLEPVQPYVQRWVDWLSVARPELGITPDTEWQPLYVSPLWIVSKYAFWNEDWEMVVAWHIMVPPDDFTEVYLRRRATETTYSLAFRQDSFTNATAPREIERPDLIR